MTEVQAGAQAQRTDQVLDLACVEAFVQVGMWKPSAASRSAIGAFPRPSPKRSREASLAAPSSVTAPG
jgi:hypothetical protein